MDRDGGLGWWMNQVVFVWPVVLGGWSNLLCFLLPRPESRGKAVVYIIGQGIGLIKVRPHGEVLNEYSTYQEKKCAKKVQHTTEGHLTRTIGTLYRYQYFTG